MKKNKMMRIASVLLVAVLISTCAISGTFAKYVTKVEGTDTARVAKWGILLTVDGADVFGTKYAAQDAKYLAAGGVYSVESSNDDKVVAPGTSSEILESNLVATVKGTPEVATRYTLVAEKLKDVYLPAGTYTDYTVLNLVPATEGTEATADAPATEAVPAHYEYNGEFTTKAYAPVKWNMTISGKGQTIDLASKLWEEMADYQTQLTAYGFTDKGVSIYDAIQIIKKVAGNTLYKQAVENVLSSVVSGGRNFQLEVVDDVLTLSYDFDANKAMDFTFTLGWEWDFDDNGAGTYDKQDTLLGNIAAGVVTVEGASTDISATFTATATQID
jgi:hypothetical protein